MVQLKPRLDNSFACPECQANHPAVNEIRFESIYILADCTCLKCGFEFYQVLPVGHMVDHPLAIGRRNEKIYRSTENNTWLPASLLRSHQERQTREVAIEKVVFVNYSKVIILNTLDSLYGHVLLKLYNAFYHMDNQKEYGLIIILPKIFKWLIPKGCAEAWIVDLTLSELIYSYESIQNFVVNEFSRFEEIHLSNAYSHPDFTTIDSSRLTGVFPFDLNSFTQRKPVVTFVLREDRWWFTSRIDYWFYRACRKLRILSWGGYMLSMHQNQLVKNAIKSIRRQLIEVDFYIIGLGVAGNFDGYAVDERKVTVDAAVEKAWCSRYAQSHVVVGVHGSNMLLPTAHAAGCVEILPEDRYGNIGQDMSVRYNNRLQLFFYRFVDQFATPRSVSSKVVSIIREYELFQKNMCINIYPSISGNDVHVHE